MLTAAANHLTAAEKNRPGPGPIPHIAFLRPIALPPHLQPVRLSVSKSDAAAGPSGPFIFNPNEAKQREAAEAAEEGPVMWVSGEVAVVSVEIRNPTALRWTVRRRFCFGLVLGSVCFFAYHVLCIMLC